MQETRQQILEILRDRSQATVNEIVHDLCIKRGENITPVTVRHHLSILQEDDLVEIPETQQRATPGRPRHVYVLTQRAHRYFPNNYHTLLHGIMKQINNIHGTEGVNVILEGVADDMVNQACIPDNSLTERLHHVCSYLNDHGYEADYEATRDGFILHTKNCPYHTLALEDNSFCVMDMRLISRMLGVVPRLVSHIKDGASSCSYFIPHTN